MSGSIMDLSKPLSPSQQCLHKNSFCANDLIYCLFFFLLFFFFFFLLHITGYKCWQTPAWHSWPYVHKTCAHCAHCVCPTVAQIDQHLLSLGGAGQIADIGLLLCGPVHIHVSLKYSNKSSTWHVDTVCLLGAEIMSHSLEHVLFLQVESSEVKVVDWHQRGQTKMAECLLLSNAFIVQSPN